MNNYIYFHILCINNYKDIFNNFIDKIKDSNLYEDIKEIRCCILGESTLEFNDPKIIIRAISNDINLYETFTINLLYEDAQKEDFNVLYIHTKGVTRFNNININDWVNYLCYFNIYNYKQCIKLLKNNDCVGVNLHYLPSIHYSGNFWWSKSEYIRKLEKCIYKTPNSPEFWLTEQNNGNYKCLWESGVNHYHQRYPEQLYSEET